jgi:hypothetical protein
VNFGSGRSLPPRFRFLGRGRPCDPGRIALGLRGVRLTATVTATATTTACHRHTLTAVYLGADVLIRAVVTPEKRKVGGSTPPLPTTNDLQEQP